MANSINYTIGSDRIDLSAAAVAEIDARRARQQLVEDPRRTRASYFDGRFLTAADLTREQAYALTRQADFASVFHGGVLRGLTVARTLDQLRVAPGSGFTPNGELVSCAVPLVASIQQIPEDDRIDLANGLV